MKKQLTLSVLKKQLDALEKEELIQLIAQIYKTSADAHLMVDEIFLGEKIWEPVFAEYQVKLSKLFYQKSLAPRLRLPDMKQANQLLKEFQKVCKVPELVIALQVHYLEVATQYTLDLGDMSLAYYNRLFTLFSDAVALMVKDESGKLEKLFFSRLKKLYQHSQGIGWGYGADLEYSFGYLFDL